LFFDHGGDFLDGADHGAERFLDADAVDFTEHVEEFAFNRVEEADESWNQPALHRVAFEVLDGMQRDLAVETVLQVAPGELGNEDFVLERADGKRKGIGGDRDRGAGDFGNHADSGQWSEVRGIGLGCRGSGVRSWLAES
jgi:hypothetical protein